MKIVDFLKKRWVLWVWNHTPNCAEMSRLLSQSCERRLPLRTRLGMRLHYLICVWCARYVRQIGFLRAAAREHAEDLMEPAPQKLSQEARERIKRMMRSGE